MTWALIDDKILTHPKMQRAEAIDGDAAWTLWSKALVYVRLHHLHGVVPGDMLALFVKHKSPSKIAATLVKVGLWEVDGENFRIHDYHHINDTPDQVEAKRQEARERMQRRRGVRANKSEQPANNGEHESGSRERSEGVRECSPSVRDPEPNRTEPSHTDPNQIRERGGSRPARETLAEAFNPKPPADSDGGPLSDGEKATLEALAKWPALVEIANPDRARKIYGSARMAMRSDADILAGIDQLGEKHGAGDYQAPTALAERLIGYIKTESEKRRAGGATPSAGGSGYPRQGRPPEAPSVASQMPFFRAPRES